MGYRKGQSGNPGGRPKAFHAMAKLILAETRGGAELVEFALAVMRGQKGEELSDGKSRRWAADFLADRSLGKPQLRIDVTTGEAEQPLNYDDLSEEQLRALAELDAASQAGPGGEVH